MEGEFQCVSCGVLKPESVPPPWLSYWPEHCGERMFLMRCPEIHAPVASPAPVQIEGGVAVALEEPPASLLSAGPTLPPFEELPVQREKGRSWNMETFVILTCCKALPLVLFVPGFLSA